MQNDFNWRDVYAAYINLEKRKDRLEHIQNELSRVGIKAERIQGMLPEEYTGDMNKVDVMWRRGKGAVGCHYSQVKVMEKALSLGKHAWVMEDDLVYADDVQERMKIISEFLNTHNWQIFWFGSTFHANNPAWWHKPGHSIDLPQCKCNYGVDVLPTDDKRFVRTLGCFSTHSYVVNVNFIPKLLEFLEENVHLSMGIDWLMILLQPTINTYCLLPGSCIQYDNMSSIGSGITVYSGFKMLGPHWFQKNLEDFNYEDFKI